MSIHNFSELQKWGEKQLGTGLSQVQEPNNTASLIKNINSFKSAITKMYL